MPWQDLPCTGDPYRNVDAAELDQISPLVQDAYVDELGYTQKRPGMSLLLTSARTRRLTACIGGSSRISPSSCPLVVSGR